MRHAIVIAAVIGSAALVTACGQPAQGGSGGSETMAEPIDAVPIEDTPPPVVAHPAAKVSPKADEVSRSDEEDAKPEPSTPAPTIRPEPLVPASSTPPPATSAAASPTAALNATRPTTQPVN